MRRVLRVLLGIGALTRRRHRRGGSTDGLLTSNLNTADLWFEAKDCANLLRRCRDRLHPGLAAELAELERAGY